MTEKAAYQARYRAIDDVITITGGSSLPIECEEKLTAAGYTLSSTPTAVQAAAIWSPEAEQVALELAQQIDCTAGELSAEQAAPDALYAFIRGLKARSYALAVQLGQSSGALAEARKIHNQTKIPTIDALTAVMENTKSKAKSDRIIIDHLDTRIELLKAVYEATGGIPGDNVKAGDQICVMGRWLPVLKVVVQRGEPWAYTVYAGYYDGLQTYTPDCVEAVRPKAAAMA